MTAPIYPIHTARLAVRPFVLADLDDYFAYMSRQEVVRYLYGGVKDRAESERALRQWMATATLTNEGERIFLAVGLAESGRVIGDVNLKWHSREHRQGETGWVFHPDFHGHGYATEAAAAVLGLGFRHFGFHRIIARCDARNTASYKVMERLGMRREAHYIQNEFVKGEWTDELVYGILEAEWSQSAMALNWH